MRIADALQRLRTAGHQIAPDQLLDLDFLTEYPIVDDSDLKRPMLYYCHAGQWLHISRTITKPYKRALEAIDFLDDDLRACRLQITWFDDAYFNPAPVSLLEDQRRGRIPLLNFFRYYACWLFIAERSKVKQFSTLTVRDGFSILIESATDQYVTLLGYVGKRLLNAVDASDQAQIFSGIAMIQHLVSAPVSALHESRRDSIADLLDESAQVELEIERRIASEIPSLISALSKAVKDFPYGEAHEIPSTYDWKDVSRIETAYPDVVDAYKKAHWAFQSLNSLTSGKRDSEWCVTFDKNFDAAFNTVCARDVVAHISMAEANATDEDAARLFFPLDIIHFETRSVLPVLKELIAVAPFRESLSNQIALLHLFLPFYIADLQTGHSGLVRSEFVKAAQVLRSCLAALPDFNVVQLQSLVVRCETTWQDWNIPIGISYGILDNAGKDLLLGSTHDAVRLLTVHCGNGREKMLDYLGRSRLHQLYADTAKKLKAVAHNDFAREHYEKYGFIATDVSVCEVLPMSSSSTKIGTNVLLPDPIPIRAKFATGWKDYHGRYSRLMGESALSDLASKFIGKMARKLAKQIEDIGFPEKDPIRNYTAPGIPIGLAGHGDIIDVLIQRRAIIRWAQVCELRRDDKAKSANRKRFFQRMGYGTRNLESYSNYFNAIGLKLENLYVPDEFGFFPEELTWLRSFRTRK